MVHEAHLLALRDLARLGVRTDVEADDRCPRRRRQRHIALGDRAGARLKHADADLVGRQAVERIDNRSEEHTSELQSLMRISYAVFCLKKKKKEISTTEKYRSGIQ